LFDKQYKFWQFALSFPMAFSNNDILHSGSLHMWKEREPGSECALEVINMLAHLFINVCHINSLLKISASNKKIFATIPFFFFYSLLGKENYFFIK
jgi:hypothetical protein